MVKCLNIGKNIGKAIYRSISSLNMSIISTTYYAFYYIDNPFAAELELAAWFLKIFKQNYF